MYFTEIQIYIAISYFTFHGYSALIENDMSTKWKYLYTNDEYSKQIDNKIKNQ